jgi:hypothetical protein
MIVQAIEKDVMGQKESYGKMKGECGRMFSYAHKAISCQGGHNSVLSHLSDFVTPYTFWRGHHKKAASGGAVATYTV